MSIEAKDGTGFTLRVATATGPGWARDTAPDVNPVPVSWTGIDTPDPGPFIAFWTYLLADSSLAVIT